MPKLGTSGFDHNDLGRFNRARGRFLLSRRHVIPLRFAPLDCAFVGNVQHCAARLAVHGIDVVAQQAAGGASEPYLGWTDQHLRKIQKQGHAEDHDNNRDQAARRTR